MNLTFEEKTYEDYFNTELSQRSKIYFPLGQVQEGRLGFDSSANSVDTELWGWLGYPNVASTQYNGVSLRKVAQKMERILSRKINNMPQMKLNLLFQYKRPVYITRASGNEWSHWKKPYYRYVVNQKQQDILMQIHTAFGNDVLVTYAAPALSNVNDLVDAHINGKIIEKSNFTKAYELDSHNHNTYIQSGTHSIACSKPQEIENFNLIEAINSYPLTNQNGTIKENKEFITSFGKRLIALMEDNMDNRNWISESLIRLNEIYYEFREFELLYSLLLMKNFRQLSGVRWLVKL